jgi:hypothetical protein
MIKRFFEWLLIILGIKFNSKHYTIESKLRKLAIKSYGENVVLHDKIAYFGTMYEDSTFLSLINKEFKIKLDSLYTHKTTTDSYRNYNSLALAIMNELNKRNIPLNKPLSK